MKAPKMIDNRQMGTVADELKSSMRKGSKLSVISAYFTLYAYRALKKELEKVDSFRMVLTEPAFLEKKEEQIEFRIQHNAEKTIAGNEFEIKLKNEMLQVAVARECAEWVRSKADVKSLKHANPAQMRMIHVDNADADESVCINGTVDFTTDGLGITASDRIDANTCLYGQESTGVYLQLFDSLWNRKTEVEDVKERLLENIQILFKENTPEFIYFVNLYHIFYDYLGELTEDNMIKTATGIQDTMIWNKLYKFQKDGVMGAIEKLEKFNGCIIADSVGLGKTFTALAVIKYYELRNCRVLVLAPKKLHDNWSVYTMNDTRNILEKDRFRYDVLNHTDLTRTSGMSGGMNIATVNWGNYDLVVIDESHNFRNNNPSNDRVTRYQKLMNDVIKAGIRTKVLMLSATPVNNRMNDIKNQISFITEGDNTAFKDAGIPSIEHVLKKAQTVFNRWSELDDEERTTEKFVDMMDVDYFKLLDTVTIARSRKHIEKYYNTNEIGKFPTRMKPVNRYTGIDISGEFPPIEKVNQVIKKLSLAVFSPLKYVLPEKRGEYEKKYDIVVGDGHSIFRQADRETNLVGLMRVNLLKRMESSINSFRLSVEKLIEQIDFTLGKIDESGSCYDQELRIEDIDPDDTLLENELTGNKVKVLLKDMDLIKWSQELEYDREQLEKLHSRASVVDPGKDAKLQELKDIIDQKIAQPFNPGNRKVIIFTAFADTASYLYDNLAPYYQAQGIFAAKVTGSGTNKSTIPLTARQKKKIKLSDISSVLTLFSPKSKEKAKVYPDVENEIDILIATDCISEGQNLQDCDFLINYDIHWNPVRIIQRFGRIDRIGSVNSKIQLLNFWPMKDLDEYINLQQRVQGRMVLLDVSATGEENIIDGSSKEMKDLEYRRKQLEKLQTEVVDLEDISGGISITDLTFNDFKMDLADYIKDNRELLEDAPTGIFAAAYIDESLRDSVEPGVLFTLKQVRGLEQTKEQNALFPYHVVYITESGEVKLTFMHGKKVLDIMKKLCSGQNEVVRELMDRFNEETDSCRDMTKYSDLLEQAIQNMIGKKQEIGVASLFSKGGTTMQKEFYDGTEDFELISFLVLKEKNYV